MNISFYFTKYLFAFACILFFTTINTAHAGNTVYATVGDYRVISYASGGSNVYCSGSVDGSVGTPAGQWNTIHLYSGSIQLGPFNTPGTFTFACYGNAGGVDYTYINVAARPTETCWNGSVITPSLGQSCPARPTETCWNGSVITPSLGQSCPAYPPAPSVGASIAPTYVSYGGSFSSMSYWSSNAVSCNYGPLSYTWGPTGPYYSSQTWTFICYNAVGQSAQQSVTLNVCPASAPTWNGSICVPPPTVTLNPFSPSTIITGNSSSFSYSSTNATTCSGFGVVTGNLGSTGTTVSTPIMNTPGTYTQSVSCTGPSGSVTSQNRALVVDGPASLTPGGAGSDSGLAGFNISPRSVDRGGLVKISWGIHYPNNQCKITAAVQIPATCDATCRADRATASSTLNSTLSSGTTNANDPYGASRNMTTALTTKVPSTQYARGEKSVTLDYSTTFTLSCGTGANTFTPAKSIIYVTDRMEG